MSKPIQIRIHARKQLKERDISEDLVKEVMLNPGQVIESCWGRKIAQSIIEYKKNDFCSGLFMKR